MTPQEYTDAARFPLTTWAGLTARTQALIDACNWTNCAPSEGGGTS